MSTIEWVCGICNAKHGGSVGGGESFTPATISKVKRLWASSCLRSKIGGAAYNYLFDIGLIPSDKPTDPAQDKP